MHSEQHKAGQFIKDIFINYLAQSKNEIRPIGSFWNTKSSANELNWCIIMQMGL